VLRVSERERERGGDGVGQMKRNEPKWQCAYKNNQRPPKGWGEIARVMAGQGEVLGWRVQWQQVCEDLD
jgi:hypothetical protein